MQQSSRRAYPVNGWLMLLRNGDVNCGKTNPREGKIALEVDTEIGRVRVILQRIGYKSYKVLTAYLLKSH